MFKCINSPPSSRDHFYFGEANGLCAFSFSPDNPPPTPSPNPHPLSPTPSPQPPPYKTRLHNAGAKWIRHEIIIFPKFVTRLHDAGTKSTLFEWVNKNESRNEWMNQTFRGCKRYEIVPYSNQSSRRTVFISYRIQMPVFSCRYRVDARPIRHSIMLYSFRAGIV